MVGTTTSPGLQRGRVPRKQVTGHKQALNRNFSDHTLPPESAAQTTALGCAKTTDAFSSVLSFALVSDKLYQRKEPVISSVHTKVKGIAKVTENVMEGGVMKSLHSVFDTADYTFPLQVSTRQLPPGLISARCLFPSLGV